MHSSCLLCCCSIAKYVGFKPSVCCVFWDELYFGATQLPVVVGTMAAQACRDKQALLQVLDCVGIAPSGHPKMLIVPSTAGALRTKEAALQALGCLGIARPSALLATGAQDAMREALQCSAPALLKMRGLHNLAELLKAGQSSLQVFVCCIHVFSDKSPSCAAKGWPQAHTGLHVQGAAALWASAAPRCSACTTLLSCSGQTLKSPCY